MSATAHSPTPTTTTATSTTNTASNMKSQALSFSLHQHHNPRGEDLSPMSESDSATSSPLYSGCGPHDDDDSMTAAVGNETLFRADHDPQLMSTPVKGDDDEDVIREVANAASPLETVIMPQQSTPISSDQPVVEVAAESTESKEEPGSKRKRDSLEGSDYSLVLPEGRVTRSVKRLKRFNTTAKGLRRNLSFNAMKSPFTSLLRRGRSSMMDTSVTAIITSPEVEGTESQDVTEPDCSTAITPTAGTKDAPNNNSPTFKTPKALPPINHYNHHHIAAGAGTVGAGGFSGGMAMDWRSNRSSIGGDISLSCLPEIQEEEGSGVVVEPEEGKSASETETDPAVEYLLTLYYTSLCCCCCNRFVFSLSLYGSIHLSITPSNHPFIQQSVPSDSRTFN